jgi:hypothetical protein
LVPGVKVLGATEDSGGSLVDGLLDVTKIRLKLHLLPIQININLKEWILIISTISTLTNHPMLHSIQ